ncbi:hypothetical protein [Porphyromonas sp. oral taxon 275]|uniref:hypothetical protein n=1 Tax=Porphyromonas sp. oral taxon 275 TaxID=712435 RepID=UPI001BA62229|nr:hypothetical protein [Porphyromonas sp. oral taxon 275]QUB42560.1 hypothetical protein J4862_06030 [Porphyromonas sp. oral taxon 275]
MTTATKAIQDLYQHWLSAKQSAEQKARKEGDLGLAERLASCEVFTGREVSIVEILDKLLSIQGREFLLLSGFPTLEVFRQYKHLIPDGYPVLVDVGEVELSDAPSILGVDVAGMGRDSSVYCLRRGAWVDTLQCHNSGGSADHMATAGEVSSRRRKDPRLFVSIDTIGEGAGVYSRLVELEGSTPYLISCKASASAKLRDKELSDLTGQYRFANLRAYLLWAVRDWLNPKHDTGAMLPPDSQLAEEMTEVRWSFRSDGKILIEPKEEVKKRLGRSPDRFDALAFTFYPLQHLRRSVDIDRLASIVI